MVARHKTTPSKPPIHCPPYKGAFAFAFGRCTSEIPTTVIDASSNSAGLLLFFFFLVVHPGGWTQIWHGGDCGAGDFQSLFLRSVHPTSRVSREVGPCKNAFRSIIRLSLHPPSLLWSQSTPAPVHQPGRVVSLMPMWWCVSIEDKHTERSLRKHSI